MLSNSSSSQSNLSNPDLHSFSSHMNKFWKPTSLTNARFPQKERKNRNKTDIMKSVLNDLKRYEEQSFIGPEVAEAWSRMGLICLYMKKNTLGAVKCFRKVLSIHKQTKSSTSLVDVAVTLTDLGKCYEMLEEHKKALSVFEEAVELLVQQQVSDNHPALAAGRRSILKLTTYTL